MRRMGYNDEQMRDVREEEARMRQFVGYVNSGKFLMGHVVSKKNQKNIVVSYNGSPDVSFTY